MQILSTLQHIIENIKYKQIPLSNKRNWNNIDIITYQNLYLADQYNKLFELNKNIEILLALSTTTFFDFLQNISSYINDNIIGSNYDYVKSLNGKIGDITGLSTITMNNITYTPNELNNGIVNLGTYLTENIVNTYNNVSGHVSGVSKISINGIQKPVYNAVTNLGNVWAESPYIYVNSINEVSGRNFWNYWI